MIKKINCIIAEKYVQIDEKVTEKKRNYKINQIKARMAQVGHLKVA